VSMKPKAPELSPCPHCPHLRALGLELVCGVRSRVFYIAGPASCEHTWNVVNYQTASTDRAATVAKWNAWVKNETTQPSASA
jgi:hypothetical protein